MKARFGAVAMLVIATVARPCVVRAVDGLDAVSFGELWRHARQHSPSLRVVHSQSTRVAAAHARVRPALAQNPVVSVQAGPRFQGGYRNYDVGAFVSQPVRIAGERRSERALADRTESRLEAEIAEQTWHFHQELRASYDAAANANAKLELLRDVAGVQQRIAALIAKQAAAGETGAIHQRLAEVESARAQRAAMQGELELRRATLELARLAGWPLHSPPSPRDEPQVVTLPDVASLLERARTTSPQLARLAAAVREGQAARALSDRQRFTEPEIGVSYSRQGTTPVSDPVSHTVSGTLSLPVPLWFRNQPERATARAEQAVLEAEQAAGEELVVAEITAAHMEVHSLGEQLGLYEREVLAQTRSHLELLARALELGEISIFDFLTAKERLLAVQLEAIEVRAAYAVARNRLELVVGQELTGGAP